MYNELVTTTKEYMRNIIQIEPKWLIEARAREIEGEREKRERRERKKREREKRRERERGMEIDRILLLSFGEFPFFSLSVSLPSVVV